MEISIHANSKKVFDYKKCSSKKLFGIGGLLAIPTSQEIQRMLDNADRVTMEYNNSMKSFEESIKGCEVSLNEVNKLMDGVYQVSDNTKIQKIKPLNVDVSGAEKIKDWLGGNGKGIPKISDVKGVNVDWIDSQIPNYIPEDANKYERALISIGELAEAGKRMVVDISWCIANPIQALGKLFTIVDPIILTGCMVIVVFGLVLYIFTDDKFFGRKPTQYIKNPIIFYIAFKVVMYLILSIA